MAVHWTPWGVGEVLGLGPIELLHEATAFLVACTDATGPDWLSFEREASPLGREVADTLLAGGRPSEPRIARLPAQGWSVGGLGVCWSRAGAAMGHAPVEGLLDLLLASGSVDLVLRYRFGALRDARGRSVAESGGDLFCSVGTEVQRFSLSLRFPDPPTFEPLWDHLRDRCPVELADDRLKFPWLRGLGPPGGDWPR